MIRKTVESLTHAYHFLFLGGGLEQENNSDEFSSISLNNTFVLWQLSNWWSMFTRCIHSNSQQLVNEAHEKKKPDDWYCHLTLHRCRIAIWIIRLSIYFFRFSEYHSISTFHLIFLSLFLLPYICYCCCLVTIGVFFSHQQKNADCFHMHICENAYARVTRKNMTIAVSGWNKWTNKKNEPQIYQ